MTFSKLLLTLATSSAFAFALASAASVSNSPILKRSSGTVIGAEPGTSYHWSSTDTSAQCPTLLASDLQTSLIKFDSLFPPQYSAGPTYPSQTTWSIGALYLSYPEGTFAFALEYTSVTPNTTSTWINAGADIANVWSAIRGDIVALWASGMTFQWVWYEVEKELVGGDGEGNLAGTLRVQIQTPTFVKGCDTSCGGTCNPNFCEC